MSAKSSKTTGASSDKRKIEADDLYRIRLVSDPQVSPDGKTVAFVQTRLRKKKNDYGSNIWLVPADGSAPASKFTGGSGRDMMPSWSGTGEEIAFLSTRSGKPQVWMIKVGGGEAQQVTFARRGVGQFDLSPDGRWIVFATQVDNDQDKQLAAEAKKKDGQQTDGPDAENRQPGNTSGEGPVLPASVAGEWAEDEEDEKDAEDKGDHAKVITRVYIKGEGVGLFQRRTHLFIVSTGGGKARQITEGDWDAGSPMWSPDGKSLAYAANKEPYPELTNAADIYVMAVDNEGKVGEARRITATDHAFYAFDWRPASDGFVFFGHTRVDEGALGTNADVFLLSMDGEYTNLTADWDRTAGTWINSDLWAGTGELRARFNSTGDTIYFMGTSEGVASVYSVPVAGGEVREAAGGGKTVLNFGMAANGIVFAGATSSHPCDLFVTAFDGKGEKQLTRANDDVQDELEIGEAKEFWLDGPGGQRLQGWMIMPPGFDESKKYPLIIQIHGGPHVAYGEAYLHEFQVLAARGHIVLYTNPRGSQGYGQEFADAILNDWGGVDYDDIMAFVDHAAALPYVDEERLGVAGGSYGGYMTTWIIGHTQRFKAAVAMRAVTNLYSAWGSGDYTFGLWSWELSGTPQERTDLYLERSPITYVKEMHTPLLLTHAEDDFRVNIEQADELYHALKVLKRTVKMVRFPSGGHDISRSGKPSLRVERIEHIADWFDEYLKP
ncbi:MAG: S9 family peptidase [Chloroflexota bacterium]